MTENSYDIIIIGGGPAGLAAGIYAARARLKTLLLEKMGCGGQVIITDVLENYPGFPEGISGFELASKMEEQARKFGITIAIEEVQRVTNASSQGLFTVKTAEEEYTAAALILASGATHKALNVPGESEFRGRGVSYCATCDGPFFRDKKVIVVGGGDSAIQEAIFLTRFAREVIVVHRRDRLRAAPILQERAKANQKIRLILNSVVTRIVGSRGVEGVGIKNVAAQKEETVAADGVFVFVGLVPNTGFLNDIITLDEAGYILTGDHMGTSLPGVFACGDVRKKMLRQVVTATGEGATAATAAQEYIENIQGTPRK